MTATIIDGKAIAESIREEVKEGVKIRLEKGLRAPGLAVIIVGDDPASRIYVNNKRKACEEVGFISKHFDLPQQIPEEDLIAKFLIFNTISVTSSLTPLIEENS